MRNPDIENHRDVEPPSAGTASLPLVLAAGWVGREAFGQWCDYLAR